MLAGLLAACAGGEVAVRGRAITDGVVDTAHIAVGYIAAGQGVGCTATMVGRRTALTAAHCLSGSAQTLVLDGSEYRSASSALHPQYVASGKDNDIGLLILERGVHLVPSTLDPASRPAGAAVTLVGYGATREGGADSGTRRKATNTIESLHTTSFNIAGTGGGQGNVCHHDSGAPVYVGQPGAETQIGVVIGGVPPCGTTGIAMRVDTYLAWIKSAAAGDMALAGATGVGFGMPCASDRDCSSGLCRQDQASGARYCAAACAAGGAPCPEGGACVSPVGGAQAVCQLPLPPEVEQTGCSVSPRGSAGVSVAFLALGLMLTLRRRRSSASS